MCQVTLQGDVVGVDSLPIFWFDQTLCQTAFSQEVDGGKTVLPCTIDNPVFDDHPTFFS